MYDRKEKISYFQCSPDEYFLYKYHNEWDQEEAEWKVEQKRRDVHLGAEFAGVAAQKSGVTGLWNNNVINYSFHTYLFRNFLPLRCG